MRFLAFIIILAIHVNIFDCANNSRILGRIIRGRSAKTAQFPYVTKIVLNTQEKKFLCGGALIGARWVLSAAHCFEDVKSAKVYLGSIFRDGAKISHQVPISDVFIHPLYNRVTEHNDIALINIPPTVLSAKIGIVPLPKLECSHSKYVNAYAIACGWGKTAQNGANPVVLQCGRWKIKDNKHCRSSSITKDQICTSINSRYAALALGDSGGPLVLERTGELVGIASLGDVENCGLPSIFTRVTSYLSWIKFVSRIYY